MNASPWTLSAAAAQLLLASSETEAAPTANSALAKLAIKELVLRGHLEVVDLKKGGWARKPSVTIATAGPAAADPGLPTTPALLAAHIPRSSGDDLAALLKRARKGQPELYADRLRGAAYGELQAHGFVEQRYRKAFGFWPSSFQALTATGVAARKRLMADRDDAQRRWPHVDTDLAGTAAAFTALGPLVLLLDHGLALVAAVAQRWGAADVARAEQAAGALHDVEPGFNVITAALEHLEPLTRRDFDGGLDGVIDAISQGLDRGTTSGGSYDSSDGCGGGSSCGGGGGGCGGS